MKQFRVFGWETVGGYVVIEAKNEEDVVKQLEKRLDNEGSSCFDEVTHRETQISQVDKL